MQITDVGTDESPIAKERDLQDAQRVIAGNVPTISESPDVIIELPRGLYTGSKWETEVELRELTGTDEEALARFKTSVDFFNGVIVYGTARIGSQDLRDLAYADRQSLLAGLLVGEREQLFLHIARVTYGDKKELEHVCPSCGTEAETVIFISKDIKVPEMENPHTLTHTMTTGGGSVLKYRLATGSDQMAVMEKKGASVAEQNTLMISECVVQVDDSPVLDPIEMARNLSMGDRRKLLENLTNQQPSPILDLKIDCISCGTEVIVPLSWGDLFRP